MYRIFLMMKVLAILSLFLLFGTSLAATDPRCSGVPIGEEYLFPYPGDCTRFVRCNNNDATIENCTGGEYFNEALQACDHPDTSGCVPLTCPPGVVDYYLYPNDCTRYVECYHGTAEIHYCPNELYFNSAQKRCVSAPESNCGEYATTASPTWTTPLHGACWGVLPNQTVLKPVEGSCTNFIECIGSRATELSCPTGLYFDSARQMCDQRALSDCNDTSGPDPDLEGYDDPRCADGNTGYWPYPVCTRFIECYAGHGYLMDCPSGLYFSEDKLICEDPASSNCGRTTPAPNPYTTIPPYIDPDCPWPSPYRYLFPFPGDCTKFMECIDGQKVVQDCPPSLYFNPTLMVCDYPYEAGCTQI